MDLFEAVGTMAIDKEEDGVKIVKQTLLVEGASFTDVEAIAIDWFKANTFDDAEESVIDVIKRVKISEIYLNKGVDIEYDSALSMTQIVPIESDDESDDVLFWEVIVAFSFLLDNGKTKISKEKFIISAKTQLEAIISLEAELSDTTIDWKTVSAKSTQIGTVLLRNETFTVRNLSYANNGDLGNLPTFNVVGSASVVDEDSGEIVDVDLQRPIRAKTKSSAYDNAKKLCVFGEISKVELVEYGE